MPRGWTFLVSAALASSLVVVVGITAQTEAQQLRPGLSALTPVGPFLLSFDENGHATIAITLDLYSHVTPTMQRQAAAALETVLRG